MNCISYFSSLSLKGLLQGGLELSLCGLITPCRQPGGLHLLNGRIILLQINCSAGAACLFGESKGARPHAPGPPAAELRAW